MLKQFFNFKIDQRYTFCILTLGDPSGIRISPTKDIKKISKVLNNITIDGIPRMQKTLKSAILALKKLVEII